MTYRVRTLTLALVAAFAGPALQAQGLRATPQLGAGRIAPVAPAALPAGARQADFIVAVVNSEPITNNEVRTRMARVQQQAARQGATLPPANVLAREVLERLISEMAQLQLARETGLKVDEAMIDQAELSVAQQNQVEVTELRRRLAADGIPLARFRGELRDQLLLTRLRDRELEPRARVTDLEVDQYMREQQAGGTTGNTDLNLAQILVAVPEGANAAQVGALLGRAQRALDRALAGEDFAKLAAEYSDAPDAARSGGQMGLRPADRYPELFINATSALREGGISAVVRSGAGFHVLKVVEKRQGGMPGATVTQHRARHILLRTGPQLTEAAARARLADFKKRIEAGSADFAQIARENSQDGSARSGGDLGWAGPGVFVPEFDEVLVDLRPGQISEPLTSRFGVHLIQLMERRQSTLSEREQREIARNLLREKKLEEAFPAWVQEVRGRAYVEFREPPQ